MSDYPKKRLIRFQFRRNGLVHRGWVTDDLNNEGAINVSGPHETLCGKRVSPGQGGWGYGRPDCAACTNHPDMKES